MNRTRFARAGQFLVVSLVVGCGGGGPRLASVDPVPPTTAQVATSVDGMVVAAQPLATAAGVEMLERGGNAVDAAVATAFAISVVEPSMNSIGGRTQILLRTSDGAFHGIDATTQAPATYDPDTAPQAGYGYPTVGVPGTVAGLTRLLDEHGTLPLATVMAPAIHYASEGFRILPGEAARQAGTADRLAESAGARQYFLKPDGSTREAGELFVQADLASTLRRIAEGGADEFYRGGIADEIVRDMAEAGGQVTRESLADYRAVDARVVRGSYRGRELVGTFPMAAGAMTIGILHILENFELSEADEPTLAAVVGQALALGFQGARTERGPDAWRTLTSKEWARTKAETIRVPTGVASRRDGGLGYRSAAMDAWRGNAEQIVPGPPARSFGNPLPADDDGHTTHLSTADGRGMTVSLTQTIGPAMGSKVAAPGLGFLYAATLGGYLGPMQPLERARSNISPLMVLEDGRPVLVLGAAGGARIVSAVVQAVVRVIDQDLPLTEALAAARLHPMTGSLTSPEARTGFDVETSPGIGWSSETIAVLRDLDFEIREVPRAGAFGRIHGMSYDRSTTAWTGVADPDWEGSAAAPRR